RSRGGDARLLRRRPAQRLRRAHPRPAGLRPGALAQRRLPRLAALRRGPRPRRGAGGRGYEPDPARSPALSPYSLRRYWMVRTLIPRISAARLVDPSTTSSVRRIASFSISARVAPG